MRALMIFIAFFAVFVVSGILFEMSVVRDCKELGYHITIDNIEITCSVGERLNVVP